jgi:thioredoxin-dependent peroxiredoxin
MGLQKGSPAPDFSLVDQNGEPVRLSGFKGKKAVVLYFYPKDETPGCTAEACTFRDSFEVFKEAGAEVLGVSGDSPESHKRFAAKYHLPFRLLSDEGDRVRELYGVSSTLGLLPGRVTFVIDKGGIVRHVFSSQFRPKKHVEEALEVLKQL